MYKIKRINNIYLLGLLSGGLLFLNSCTDTSTDKPQTDIKDSIVVDTTNKTQQVYVPKNQDTLSVKFKFSPEDIELLSLLNKLKGGDNFMEIKEVYSGLKGIRPEEKDDKKAEVGFTESVNKFKLFDLDGKNDFHFKDDSLYAFNFVMSPLKTEDAEELFAVLYYRFESQWGDAQNEQVEEENHYMQNYVWGMERGMLCYLSFNANTNVISFGKRYPFRRVL